MNEAFHEPLREIVRRHGLTPDKRLGQNFLFDDNLLAKIARAAGPWEDGARAYEVGPGPGGLTRALLLEGAAHVVAVERDARFRPALQALGEAADGRLTLRETDALETDEAALLPDRGGPIRIAANLPYNVATPLIIRWLAARPLWWASMTVLVQKEVAERLTAQAGDKAYGRLGVLLAAQARARRLFDVAPGAFTPPPKVTSSLVRVEPTTPLDPALFGELERLTAAAFGQRRKMLRASLKTYAAALGLSAEAFLATASVSPTARAETVPVDRFLTLARAALERRG